LLGAGLAGRLDRAPLHGLGFLLVLSRGAPSESQAEVTRRWLRRRPRVSPRFEPLIPAPRLPQDLGPRAGYGLFAGLRVSTPKCRRARRSGSPNQIAKGDSQPERSPTPERRPAELSDDGAQWARRTANHVPLGTRVMCRQKILHGTTAPTPSFQAPELESSSGPHGCPGTRCWQRPRLFPVLSAPDSRSAPTDPGGLISASSSLPLSTWPRPPPLKTVPRSGGPHPSRVDGTTPDQFPTPHGHPERLLADALLSPNRTVAVGLRVPPP